MIASLPPAVKSLLRGLRRRIWRDGLLTRLGIGAWAAGAVICAGGIVHVALTAQDRSLLIAVAFAVLAVAAVAGIARRLPTMARAAAEADSRYRASELFASAWEVADSPPERRTGAASLVLARAETFAAQVVRTQVSPVPARHEASRWLPLALFLVGGVLLLLPGAGATSQVGEETAGAANPSPSGPTLDAVIAAVERGARVDRVEPAIRQPSPDGRQEPSLDLNVGVAPLPGARTTPGAPVLPLDAPGSGETPTAGGTDAGNAPGSRVARSASDREDAPDEMRRVALDRRAGGTGEGGVPLAPVGTLPNPLPDAAPAPAGDAAPWPASWSPALRRYVSAVLARPERSP
jgi:hypothetical protein